MCACVRACARARVCVCVCVCARVRALIFCIVMLEPLLMSALGVCSLYFISFFLITFSISMCIMCVILCFFRALSRRVGALQISIIIMYYDCGVSPMCAAALSLVNNKHTLETLKAMGAGQRKGPANRRRERPVTCA